MERLSAGPIKDILIAARNSSCEVQYLINEGLIIGTEEASLDDLLDSCECCSPDSGVEYYTNYFTGKDIYVSNNFSAEFRQYLYANSAGSIIIDKCALLALFAELANVPLKTLYISHGYEFCFPRIEFNEGKVRIFPKACDLDGKLASHNFVIDLSETRLLVIDDTMQLGYLPQLQYLFSLYNIVRPKNFAGLLLCGEEFTNEFGYEYSIANLYDRFICSTKSANKR